MFSLINYALYTPNMQLSVGSALLMKTKCKTSTALLPVHPLGWLTLRFGLIFRRHN